MQEYGVEADIKRVARNRQIIRDRVAGATFKEIAEKHGIHACTARQVVEHVKRHMANAIRRRRIFKTRDLWIDKTELRRAGIRALARKIQKNPDDQTLIDELVRVAHLT